MKNLILTLAIVVGAIAMSACSKDSGNNGNYVTTPGAINCANGTYPGMNYQQMYQQGYPYSGYYPNQYPQQNCIQPNNIYGGNPYYFQANYQMYLGTCDLRFSGRGQLCPIGYQCQPAFGSMGICMRGY